MRQFFRKLLLKKLTKTPQISLILKKIKVELIFEEMVQRYIYSVSKAYLCQIWYINV